MGREEEVRLIAYRIWQEENCLDGRDCEHWVRAEVIWEDQQKEKLAAERTPIKDRDVSKQDSKVATKKKSLKK